MNMQEVIARSLQETDRPGWVRRERYQAAYRAVLAYMWREFEIECSLDLCFIIQEQVCAQLEAQESEVR